MLLYVHLHGGAHFPLHQNLIFKRTVFTITYMQGMCVCSVMSDYMGCSLPGSSVHGISQARILEWVAISSSRGSSRPREQSCISSASPALAGRFLTTEPRLLLKGLQFTDRKYFTLPILLEACCKNICSLEELETAHNSDYN